MSQLEVRIVKLEPMRVASVHAFGSSPELEAWRKLVAWAKPKGLLDFQRQRIFGFNNPNPSAGSPNYGYEYWITVGPDVRPDGEVTIKEFPAGLYAVARCKGVQNITSTWHQLAAWAEDSQYKFGSQWCAEEHLTSPDVSLDDLLLDLYLPITG